MRSIVAILCPIVSHFNALDFSECHSEEVMFLLMFSALTFNHSLSSVQTNKQTNKHT